MSKKIKEIALFCDLELESKSKLSSDYLHATYLKEMVPQTPECK